MPNTRPMRAIVIKSMNPTVTSSIAVSLYTGDGGQYHPFHGIETDNAAPLYMRGREGKSVRKNIFECAKAMR
jgi:hypothetical protein